MPSSPSDVRDGIVKPLPPEWFTKRDTSAEMRWEAMQGQGELVPTERFFVRNHTSTPLVDPLTYRLELFGRGLRGGPVRFTYDELTALPSRERTVAIECAGNGRSLFASQQGMACPARVGARGDRRHALARRAARRGARARRDPRRGGRPDAGRARRALRRRRHRPRARAAAAAGRQGARRRPARLRDERRDAAARPRLPDAARRAGLDRDRERQVGGRIEVSTTRLWSPWNTKWYPRSFSEQVVKSAFELPWDAALPPAAAACCRGARGRRAAPSGGSSHHRRRRELAARAPGRAEPLLRWVRFSLPWTPRRRGRTELLSRATAPTACASPTAAVQLRGLHVLGGRPAPGDGQRVSRPASITSVVPVT